MWDKIWAFILDHWGKITGIISFATINIIYIYNWFMKRSINQRVNSFKNDKSPNGALKHYQYDSKEIAVLNHSNSDLGNDPGLKITFYEYKNVFYNNNNNLRINNDFIPTGHYLFKLRKDSIELIYIDSGKIKKTLLTIHNVVGSILAGPGTDIFNHTLTPNRRKFEELLSWKNKKKEDK
ncbi:hypothetical protein GCL60_16955 (plasmid) [Silvanigrella paludirubra]|uniref:Uncharacterized protein n=1 Tax=Silvanigrella paludirubra TaxID=2499159 RepID=A0A6N6VN30_9BACT|nr:hypothetical protein [Silvanigrella paludirubra]KAB8035637.1 hypothetical protein GCL60_16955 [Silvanigrella paludirubra]